MKGRVNHVQPREDATPTNERARLEIDNFLRALGSYPDRFAKEPDLSFEQHLCRFLTTTQLANQHRS